MGASQPWRWTALTSGGAAAAGQPQVSCGPSAVTQHQAAAAVQAASLHAGSAAGGVTAGQLTGTPAAANHHLATQPGLNYAAQVLPEIVFLIKDLAIHILGGQFWIHPSS